jgi:hypothetical protein
MIAAQKNPARLRDVNECNNSPTSVFVAGEYLTDFCGGCGRWCIAKNGSSALTLNAYEESNTPSKKRYAGATYVHQA